MAESDDGSKKYCVYLLLSKNPNYKGKIYIGFTVDPDRRLEQHNSGMSHGGAKKTDNKGPWEMVLVVHGFPNENLALRFEWAWQNPALSRRLQNRLKKREYGETDLFYNLRVLEVILVTGPWRRLPLQVQWLSENKMAGIDQESYLHSVSYLSEIPGKCSIKSLPTSLIKNLSLWSSLDLCFICSEFILNGKVLLCPNTPCSETYHIECLAEHFGLNDYDEVIPEKGSCPSCHREMLWCDVIVANDDSV